MYNVQTGEDMSGVKKLRDGDMSVWKRQEGICPGWQNYKKMTGGNLSGREFVCESLAVYASHLR